MLYLIKQSMCMCCSAVGIATHYELDGPGIQFRWKRNFPHLSGPFLVTTQPPVKKGTEFYQWVKGPRRGVDRPPPPSPEVKERVVFCLYSPFGPSKPVIVWRYMSSGMSSHVALVKIFTSRHGVNIPDDLNIHYTEHLTRKSIT